MVSTRQMSSVSGGSGEGSSSNSHTNPDPQPSTSKILTRYNTVITSIGVQSQSQPGPSNAIQRYEPSSSPNQQVQKEQTIFLTDLPQEIIEKILSFLTFKNIANLRTVSQTMDRICGQILNSTFQKLQTQMLQRFQTIKSKMPRRESARRSHPLACESDIVETLHMRLTLLQMTFGKHIERRHCCFFPGEILDEVYRILHYIKITPKLARPYKVTDELFDLSTMAMEYFKEHIEPKLPEIAYFSSDFLDFTTFSSGSSKNYLCLDSPPQEDSKDKDDQCNEDDIALDGEQIPQSNMVLRKRIRKIKQGMKRYNSQLSLLRQDLRSCKRKTAEQQKQIAEQQKQLAEQQKQTLEYATRLDENDKKNEEISRKFSTLLQELNKCKTELQYWRSKSPATPPVCSGCGNIMAPLPQEDLQALMNQGVMPEGLGLNPELPLQQIDFIPIAGSSTDEPDNPEPNIWEENAAPIQKEAQLITEDIVTSKLKRKAEDISSSTSNNASQSQQCNNSETPTCAPKQRRINKRGKRSYVKS